MIAAAMPLRMFSATIAWEDAQNVGADSDVSTEGELLYAYNENNVLATYEQDRDILAKQDVFTSTRVFTMHPRGVKWVGTPTGSTPSNSELATSTNWALVEAPKNVAIAQVLTKV